MKRGIAALLLMAGVVQASAWSGKGHQVAAYIAKRHLSTEAYGALNGLLDGSSIVYYASWLDNVRDDAEYAHTAGWHYINVDEGEDYENRSSLSRTDAVAALYEQAAVLKSRATTDEEKALAAKVIIHVVGDLHQPMHCGHSSDSGGNDVMLVYGDAAVSLHHLWDYYMVNDAHPWNYYEWATNLDVLSAEEAAALADGTFDDWARESVALAGRLYEEMPQGYEVTAADVERWTPEVEQQLCKAGLRLAATLNAAFDTASGIVAAVTADDVAEEYFTLQGVKVVPAPGASLPVGIYITSRHRKVVVLP